MTKVEEFYIDCLKDFFKHKDYKYSINKSGGIVIYNPRQARERVYEINKICRLGVDYDIMKKLLEELEASPWN